MLIALVIMEKGAKRYNPDYKKIYILKFAIAASLIIVVIDGLLLFSLGHKKVEDFEMKAEIVALGGKAGPEGSFFVGIGNIKTIPHYLVFLKQPDGGAKLFMLDFPVVTIHEEDRKDGVLVEYGKKITYSHKDSKISWMFWPMDWSHSYESSDGGRFHLHVPQGSIKKDFSVDINKM
jgi:hypothetical protein